MSLRLIRPRLGELILTAFAGHAVPVELRALSTSFGLGGVVLRPENVADMLQAGELTREARTLALETPLWVASHPDADMVAALRPPLTTWPALVTLGRADDLALTRAYAAAAARQALAIGLTLTFAPVVDLRTSSIVPRLAETTLASDAGRVARHAAAIVEVCQAAGLACCVGHFPGIGALAGDGTDDTPGAAPLLDLPPEQLAREDRQPFAATIAAGAAAVLVGHVFAPALDPDAPAGWSPTIVEQTLRPMLAADRAIVSDDLARMPWSSDDPGEHPAVRALRAGCDVVWRGDGDLEQMALALESVVYAAERKQLAVPRLEDALRRHEAMKARTLSRAARRLLPPTPTLTAAIGQGDDERVAERMRSWM